MAEKTFSIDLEEELHERAFALGRKRKMPVKAVYAEALKSLLDGDAFYPYKPGNRVLHDQLERILNSGDEPTIKAVVPNIEVFYARLKPGRKAAGKLAG